MRERLWLVGMMGSGKSTVGSAVAKSRGADFTDTDRLIEERAGMSIPELFETIGVVAFRDLERQAVETASTSHGVIATGGGAVLDAGSRRIMAETGLVIYLSAEPATLARRVGDTAGRPLLEGPRPIETLANILEERQPHYRAVADHIVISNGRRRRDVVEEVMRMTGGRGADVIITATPAIKSM